jgi:uncharacterized protein (TIGR00369 family)
MDWIREWVEKSPYSAALGVGLDALGETEARLVLPYQDANSNPGKALHGGCAASLGVIGGQVVTRAALGADMGPFHTAGLQINYLAAAIGEEVVGRAKLLRRGKELCFSETFVETADGKPIAHITSVVRGRAGEPAAKLIRTRGDDGASDPGAMGPHVGRMPFTSERGLEVQHMTGGHSRITMPLIEKNADASGGVHEGAMIALFDTTGAMASWAETGPGRFKASTPSLQAQFLGEAPEEDLVGFGHVVQRDTSFFWSDVEVAGVVSGNVFVRGTVLYRIIT